MRTPVDVQVWRLSVLFLVGAASDLVFQSYRAFRAVFRPRRFSYHLLDAFVALLLLSSLAFVVFIVNWGELRMYVPLSMLFGALLTHASVGSILYRRTYGLFAGTKRGIAWSQRKVIAPTKQAVRRSAGWVKTTLFPPPPPTPPPDSGDSPDKAKEPDDIPPATPTDPAEPPTNPPEPPSAIPSG